MTHSSRSVWFHQSDERVLIAGMQNRGFWCDRWEDYGAWVAKSNETLELVQIALEALKWSGRKSFVV